MNYEVFRILCKVMNSIRGVKGYILTLLKKKKKKEKQRNNNKTKINLISNRISIIY